MYPWPAARVAGVYNHWVPSCFGGFTDEVTVSTVSVRIPPLQCLISPGSRRIPRIPYLIIKRYLKISFFILRFGIRGIRQFPQGNRSCSPGIRRESAGIRRDSVKLGASLLLACCSNMPVAMGVILEFWNIFYHVFIQMKMHQQKSLFINQVSFSSTCVMHPMAERFLKKSLGHGEQNIL